MYETVFLISRCCWIHVCIFKLSSDHQYAGCDKSIFKIPFFFFKESKKSMCALIDEYLIHLSKETFQHESKFEVTACALATSEHESSGYLLF